MCATLTYDGCNVNGIIFLLNFGCHSTVQMNAVVHGDDDDDDEKDALTYIGYLHATMKRQGSRLIKLCVNDELSPVKLQLD